MNLSFHFVLFLTAKELSRVRREEGSILDQIKDTVSGVVDDIKDAVNGLDFDTVVNHVNNLYEQVRIKI